MWYMEWWIQNGENHDYWYTSYQVISGGKYPRYSRFKKREDIHCLIADITPQGKANFASMVIPLSEE